MCTPKTLTVLGVEYQVVRQLGMGSYAQVFEVVRVHDGVRLAAKCVDQGPLSTWARKQLVCEVEIQQSLQHPSILRMHAAGEDAATGKYVSIQDVAYGGELFERIMEQSSFVEDDARRVIAQLLAAVDHMHSRGVLHRDLKPENILLDEVGHICLTDFGLSKESVATVNAAKTFCGTPEYLAPEILQGVGHGKPVDWWSLGTLVFEMLTGLPPFYSRNINHMYEKILKAELRCPSYLPADVKGLIEGLLIRDPVKRLGSGPGDIKELEANAFFKDLDFKKVEAKEYTPIYKPNIGNLTDTGNFDPQFTAELPVDSVVDSSALAGQGNTFEGFTYNPNDDSALKQ